MVIGREFIFRKSYCDVQFVDSRREKKANICRSFFYELLMCLLSLGKLCYEYVFLEYAQAFLTYQCFKMKMLLF